MDMASRTRRKTPSWVSRGKPGKTKWARNRCPDQCSHRLTGRPSALPVRICQDVRAATDGTHERVRHSALRTPHGYDR